MEMKAAVGVIVAFVLGFMVATCITSPTELSEAEADRMAKSMVDEFLANPAYLDQLDNYDYDALVAAYMANPEYVAWLESPATTREEDCAGVIVGYLAVSGDYSTLPDDDVKSLCDWYEARLGPK